jgi:hypothetical protein
VFTILVHLFAIKALNFTLIKMLLAFYQEMAEPIRICWNCVQNYRVFGLSPSSGIPPVILSIIHYCQNPLESVGIVV